MLYRFGQVEEALALAHGIPEFARSQFRARIRNLYRLGLTMSGEASGKRANFTARDCLRLALAIEFMQCGITPERIVLTLQHHWPFFKSNIDLVRRGDDRRFYMVCNPNSILSETIVRFEFLDMRSLHDRLMGSEYLTNPRAIIISVAGVLDKFMRSIELVGLDRDLFFEGLAKVAEPLPTAPVKTRRTKDAK